MSTLHFRNREKSHPVSSEKSFVAKRHPTFELMKRILASLKTDEYVTSTIIATKLGISRPTAKRYLDALVELGTLMRKGVPAKIAIGGREVYFKQPLRRRAR